MASSERVVNVSGLSKGAPPTWDDCTARSPWSTFFHQWAWLDVLESSYGIRVLRLALEQGGELVGTMGLSLLTGVLGNRIVSLPFSDYGGPALVSPSVKDAVNSYCVAIDKIASQQRCKYVLIKSVPDSYLPAFVANGFALYSNLVTFKLDLHSGISVIRNRFEKRTRRAIRKATGNELSIKEANDATGVILLYRLYIESMHRLGSPPHSIRYFTSIMTALRNRKDWKLVLCFQGQECVGAILLFLWKGTAHYYIGAWNDDGLRLGVPSYLLNHAIGWAVEAGFHEFDFGRTRPESGVFLFKRGFGGKVFSLNSMIKMYYSGRPLDPSDSRYRVLSNVLKATPTPVFSTLAPTIKSRLE